MPITVNTGEILQCNQTDNIRTRGCDPCVGLIVIYVNENNAIKKCAHFSVNDPDNILQNADQNTINQVLNPILEEFFPLAGIHFQNTHFENIHAVGFTWGGGAEGQGSNFIFNRLRGYFSEENIVIERENIDNITTHGLNIQIGYQNAFNPPDWPWTNDPANNHDAQLNLENDPANNHDA
ncbi:MAG: hypothetical protein F6K14_18770 [Symploca sp. SIO2C1]|nr:hypothetical protein [Symploca sp. SIO2C1]